MARKIIFFMSDLKPERKFQEPQMVICPSGEPVAGIQTNEAPALWLLREYPGITEILCIVTEKALDTAFSFFEASILSRYPNVSIVPIEYDNSESFEAGPLSKLIEYLDKDDEILLDTTGGLRNNIMHLMLIARVLSFRGNRLLDAVYCNLGNSTPKLESVLPLFRHMELINGMQNLTTFGSVRLLEDYYSADDTSAEMRSVLHAAKKLQGALSVCDTEHILPYASAVKDAVTKAKASMPDALTNALLDVYESKFVKEFNTPGIIRWCLDNNMLQQALTIYNVWIPEYLLCERKDLFSIEKEKLCTPSLYFKSPFEATFERYVLCMSDFRNRSQNNPSTPHYKDSDPQIETLLNLKQLLPESFVKIKSERFYSDQLVQQIKQILADYMYVRLLRNRINHAFGSESPDMDKGKDRSQKLASTLREMFPTFPDIMNPQPEEIEKFLRNAMDHMKRKN